MFSGTAYVPAGASALTFAAKVTVVWAWLARSPIIWGSDFMTTGAAPAPMATVTNFAVVGASARSMISGATCTFRLSPLFSITTGIWMSPPAEYSFVPAIYAVRFGVPSRYFVPARAGAARHAIRTIRIGTFLPADSIMFHPLLWLS